MKVVLMTTIILICCTLSCVSHKTTAVDMVKTIMSNPKCNIVNDKYCTLSPIMEKSTRSCPGIYEKTLTSFNGNYSIKSIDYVNGSCDKIRIYINNDDIGNGLEFYFSFKGDKATLELLTADVVVGECKQNIYMVNNYEYQAIVQ